MSHRLYFSISTSTSSSSSDNSPFKNCYIFSEDLHLLSCSNIPFERCQEYKSRHIEVKIFGIALHVIRSRIHSGCASCNHEFTEGAYICK